MPVFEQAKFGAWPEIVPANHVRPSVVYWQLDTGAVLLNVVIRLNELLTYDPYATLDGVTAPATGLARIATDCVVADAAGE